MRTAKRRHNDEKKLKQRIRMCRSYSRWSGKEIILPPRAIHRMKNGHRSEYKYHGCRCIWCMEGKLHRGKKGDQIADWDEGIEYKHLVPRRQKAYYCDDLDSASKWRINSL